MAKTSMNLEENIVKLNIKYAPFKLKFIYQKDKRRILIKENFVINSDPKLKAELKKEYSISFDWPNKYWYIGEIGINKLSKRVKKIEPFKSIDELKEELSTFIDMKDELIINHLENYREFILICAFIWDISYTIGTFAAFIVGGIAHFFEEYIPIPLIADIFNNIAEKLVDISYNLLYIGETIFGCDWEQYHKE